MARQRVRGAESELSSTPRLPDFIPAPWLSMQVMRLDGPQDCSATVLPGTTSGAAQITRQQLDLVNDSIRTAAPGRLFQTNVKISKPRHCAF